MPQTTPRREPAMPIRAIWMLDQLREPMKGRAMAALQESALAKGGSQSLTIEDVQAAIARAFSDRVRDQSMQPDPAFCDESLRAFRGGRSKSLEECFDGVPC